MEEWPIHWLHLVGTHHIRITRKSTQWFRSEWYRLYDEDIDLCHISHEYELRWVRSCSAILIDRLIDELSDDPVFID